MRQVWILAGLAGGLVLFAADAGAQPLGARSGVMVDPLALPTGQPLSRQLVPSLPQQGTATSPALRQGWRGAGAAGLPGVSATGAPIRLGQPVQAPSDAPRSQFLAATPQPILPGPAAAPAPVAVAGIAAPAPAAPPQSGLVARPLSTSTALAPAPSDSAVPPGLIRQSFPRLAEGEATPMPPRRGLELPPNQPTLPPPQQVAAAPAALPPLPAAPALPTPPQPAAGGGLQSLPPLPPLPLPLPQSATPSAPPAPPPPARAQAPAPQPPAPAPRAVEPPPSRPAPAPAPAAAAPPPRPAPAAAPPPAPAARPGQLATVPSIGRVGGGEVVRLPFEGQSTDLAPAAQRALQPIVQRLNADPEMRIVVRGFAAAQGDSPGAARRIGLNRATAVRGALVQAGIAAARIVIQAPPTPEGDPAPDRVEIELP